MNRMLLLLALSLVLACGTAYLGTGSPETGTGDVQFEPTATGIEPVELVGRPVADQPEAEPDHDLYEASYLEATVEACAPVEGSPWDPCDPLRFDDYLELEPYNHPEQTVFDTNEIMAFDAPIYPPHSTREWVRYMFSSASEPASGGESRLPQVVVRGVYLPDSTRYSTNDLRVYHDGSQLLTHDIQDVETTYFYLACYVDLQARDYLFGNGPEKLTLRVLEHPTFFRENYDLYQIDEYLAALASHVADIWEGAEVIAALMLNYDHSIEVWHSFWSKILERGEDGRIIVKFPGTIAYGPGQPIERYMDRLEPTLHDFTEDLVQGFEEASAEYGLTPGGDANQKFLREHFKRFGVHDLDEIEIALPPPNE